MAQNEEMSVREKQVAEREKRIAELNPPLERVRVTPANDDLRRVLAHPNGVGFEASGSAEWPLDKFTRRRITDGDVTIEGGRKADAAPPPRSATAKPAAPPAQPPTT